MDSELELLGERIAEQAAHFDAAMHRLLTDLRDFDERGGWHIQGASSCAHWLAWRVGWDLVTARERVRVASRLGGFPTIDDALRRGEVSYSKVRAMMRVATPANELLLLEHARLMTASGLENLCRKYAMVQRHSLDPRPQDDEQRRYVRRRDTEDGMVKIEAVLHPEEAELVWRMLDHAATQRLRGSTSSPFTSGSHGDSAESPVPAPPSAPRAEPPAPTPPSAPRAELPAPTPPSAPRAEPQVPTPPSAPRAEPPAPTPPSAPRTEPQAPTPPSAPRAEPQAPTPPSAPRVGALVCPREDPVVSRASTEPASLSTSSLAHGLGCAISDSAESLAPIQSVSPPFTSTAHDIIYASTDSEEPLAPPHPVSPPSTSTAHDIISAISDSEKPLAPTQAVSPPSTLTAHDIIYAISDSEEPLAPTQAVSPPSTLTVHDIIYAISDSEEPLAPIHPLVLPAVSIADSPASPISDSMGSMTSTQASAGMESEAGWSRSPHHPAAHNPSVLQQRADAAQRAFSRADALVSLAQGYLRGDRPDRAPIEIVLTIPAGGLLSDARDPVAVGDVGQSFVSRDAARRLSCDAGVIEVVEDDQGTPLSVGRKRRAIAGSLKRALRKRDRGCSYPGCTHQVYLEGHHIRHWADGGETSLNNACLLCSHHHRFVHEYGYAVELGADGRPHFRDPRGALVAVVPPRPLTAALGWSSITTANAPLEIDANTIACEWDGTRSDYGAMVGYLLAADGLAEPATPAPGGPSEAWRIHPAV